MTGHSRVRTALGTLAVSALGCLLAPGTSEAVLIRHDRKVDQYRKRGGEPQFQSVGRDHIKGTTSASGVLVAPTWVLTCAHVAVTRRPEDHEWEFGGKRYRPIRTVLHPSYKPWKTPAAPRTPEELTERRHKWKSEFMANGWDLALVELDRPVESVKPARRYRGDKEVGCVATFVGYGRRGDGMNGPDSPTVQERLGGDNTIDAAGGTVGQLELTDRVLVIDFDHPDDAKSNWSGGATPLDLEAGNSSGDSGGGLFIESGGDWHLAGITSGGVPRSGKSDEPPSSKYGQISLFVRVASWNKWVDEVTGGMGEKATRPGTPSKP